MTNTRLSDLESSLVYSLLLLQMCAQFTFSTIDRVVYFIFLLRKRKKKQDQNMVVNIGCVKLYTVVTTYQLNQLLLIWPNIKILLVRLRTFQHLFEL